VTLASLGLFAWKNFQEEVYVLSLIAALLFVLAISLMVLATKSLKKEVSNPAKTELELQSLAEDK
jgi:carbon starvation protein